MLRVTNKDLFNLANRVLKFYRTRMNITSDTYYVDVEALAVLLGFRIQNVSLGEDAEIMGFTAYTAHSATHARRFCHGSPLSAHGQCPVR